MIRLQGTSTLELYSDQGRNFKHDLFPKLFKQLVINKTGTIEPCLSKVLHEHEQKDRDKLVGW